MTLQATGAVSFSQLNTELLKSPTAQLALNDSLVRGLFGVTSGAIGINNGYGKQYRIWANITISANTANYSLTSAVVNTFLGSGYVAGITDTVITINSGVYVYSPSTATPAFSISSFTSGDTVKIINNGAIIGTGGAGGTGANYGGSASAGNDGGTALYSRFATSVQNNGGIAGGGGGGGGGGYQSRTVSSGKSSSTLGYGGGGGGGGSGYGLGLGGSGGTGGNQGTGGSGSNGTQATGGLTGVTYSISGTAAENGTVTLTAPAGSTFTSVDFASYGTPTGTAPNFAIGGCHATNSVSVVQGYLIGQSGTINIPATNAVFGDPCNGTAKSLYITATATAAGIVGTGGAAGSTGGYGVGGAGGAPGTDGVAGQNTNPGAAGLAGYYIDGSSYVTWLTLGTVVGRTV
jgi:hypothetical protein